MTISNMVREAHSNAVDKGFWDNSGQTPNIGEKLMLIVSECSEALEALRKTDNETKVKPLSSQWDDLVAEYGFETVFREDVKNTFEDELADVLIRVADLAGYMGIDLETHVELKMRYNRGRERLHGKKF